MSLPFQLFGSFMSKRGLLWNFLTVSEELDNIAFFTLTCVENEGAGSENDDDGIENLADLGRRNFCIKKKTERLRRNSKRICIGRRALPFSSCSPGVQSIFQKQQFSTQNQWLKKRKKRWRMHWLFHENGVLTKESTQNTAYPRCITWLCVGQHPVHGRDDVNSWTNPDALR